MKQEVYGPELAIIICGQHHTSNMFFLKGMFILSNFHIVFYTIYNLYFVCHQPVFLNNFHRVTNF